MGDNENYPMSGSDPLRQARVHTCFSYCSNGVEAYFSGDDRPNCVDLIPSERTSLICLYPEEQCEGTTVKNMVQVDKGGKFNISVDNAIIAIIIANPLQLLFEILCLILMKMKVNPESAKENCNLLAFQCLMTLTFVYLVAQATWDIQYLISAHKDALVIVYTYIFAFIVD